MAIPERRRTKSLSLQLGFQSLQNIITEWNPSSFFSLMQLHYLTPVTNGGSFTCCKCHNLSVVLKLILPCLSLHLSFSVQLWKVHDIGWKQVLCFPGILCSLRVLSFSWQNPSASCSDDNSSAISKARTCSRTSFNNLQPISKGWEGCWDHRYRQGFGWSNEL